MRDELLDQGTPGREEIAPPAYLQQVRAITAPPQAVVDRLILQLGGTPIADSGRLLGPPNRTSAPGADQPGGAADGASAIALPPLPEGVAGPWLLGQVHEALLDGDQRTARGAWFTPPSLARRLIAAAGVTAPQRVLDPACGGGVFLLAAHDAFADAHLAGRDIDSLAAEVTRAALGLAGAPDVEVLHADGLAAIDGQYDLVVGNPPFLSQLRGATARDEGRRQMVLARFGTAAAGYVDEAGLFLLATATDSLAPGGVAVLIVPEALLATAAAAGLRREISRHCTVEVVWRDRERIFPQTPTCAVRLVRRAAVAQTEAAHTAVCRHEDAKAPEGDTPGEAAGSSEAAGEWAQLLAEGVPRVPLRAGWRTVGAIATATADFRDAYYLLAEHVREATVEADTMQEGQRIVTVGLIDPAHLRWGQTTMRFGKRTWRRPVAVGLPRSFLERRLGPKVLLATQSPVLEALVDADGDLLPSTPVITIRSDHLWHVGAALTSPVPTAIAARRHAGAARSRHGLKLSARQVLELPLPPGPSPAWDDAATAYRQGHAVEDPDRRLALLTRCGVAMMRAYGIHDGGLVSWWCQRLATRMR
ncbi:MAG TPA: N-6 DNA methylase [Euzebya sp.]|nr:N-6 DNA methylase [Euzebya sp.]